MKFLAIFFFLVMTSGHAQVIPKDDFERKLFLLDRQFDSIAQAVKSFGFANCHLPDVMEEITPQYTFSPAQRNYATWSIGRISGGTSEQGYVCLTGDPATIFPDISQGLMNRHAGLVSGSSCPLAQSSAVSGNVHLTYWLPVQDYPADCHLGIVAEE